MSDHKKLTKDLPILKDDGKSDHLLHKKMSQISLPNQDDIFLNLERLDTFRIVLYFFPMTGRPDKKLPDNWNIIPGAKGCTLQTCSIRDNYDNLVRLNALPIGVSTQRTIDLKEMTQRLLIPYDILSDESLKLMKELDLPSFSINEKTYFKRLTLILEKSIIKKVFYPIYNPDKHIVEILEWLKIN